MPMRKFTRAGALAAAAMASALLAAPAAGASQARAPARVLGARGTLSHIQPGGPLVAATGRGAAVKNWAASTHNVTSDNWGGFVAGHRGTRFRFIQATFFVPYLDCAHSPGALSGHWVGLDGLGSATVEQDGILAACQGATAKYASWYEMFPAPPVYSRMQLRPGNSIVASVYYSSRTHKFTLKLANTTNGQSFTVVRRCARHVSCQRISAEAISEAPSDATGVLPLADFRAESYSGIKVSSQAGRRGGLRSPWWDTLSVTTVSSATGALLDQPTSISRGTAFDMYWMRMS